MTTTSLVIVLQLCEGGVEQLLAAASYLQIESVLDACSQVSVIIFRCYAQNCPDSMLTGLLHAVSAPQRMLPRALHLDNDAR